MPLEEYLADPCPEPSLNHSLAKILLSKSPQHAFLAHPRLAPAPPRNHSDAFDKGTSVHEAVLEGVERMVEVNAPDWKKKPAQDARKAARKAGKVAMLSHQLSEVRLMADAIKRQVRLFPEPFPLLDGLPERVLVWKEGAIWCRARLDWLHHDRQAIDDLKTTGESGHPAEWTRRLFDRGDDLQAAFHTRGVQKVYGLTPEFRFLVAETEAPYALSLIALDPEAQEFAKVRMLTAIETWARCLRTQHWPGYARRPVYAAVPPWVQTRWIEAQYYEEAIRDA